MQKTDWNRGYFRALYGMYLSRKNGATDDYAFFSKLDLSDKAALHTYRKEFLDHMRNGLHGDFDRGYFSAWADCMRILTRMEIPKPQNGSDKATERRKNRNPKKRQEPSYNREFHREKRRRINFLNKAYT